MHYFYYCTIFILHTALPPLPLWNQNFYSYSLTVRIKNCRKTYQIVQYENRVCYIYIYCLKHIYMCIWSLRLTMYKLKAFMIFNQNEHKQRPINTIFASFSPHFHHNIYIYIHVCIVYNIYTCTYSFIIVKFYTIIFDKYGLLKLPFIRQ
jgi:hypothetical protein